MSFLFNTRSFSSYQLSKNERKKILTKFNYNLFKLNENFRDKSIRYTTKSSVSHLKTFFPQKKTGNIYLDNMITIESRPKEKIKNGNKKLVFILKRPKEIVKDNSYQNYFNLALVPKKNKINRFKNLSLLNNENSKIHKNYLSERKELLKRNLNINISNSNLNTPFQFANHYNKKPEDTYSDCRSLKGVMIDIKKKIKENKFNVNKIFGEFDKQIVQEQYLIERFYEMKKNIIEKNEMIRLKKNFKNKKILSNFDKIIQDNIKNKK